MDNDGRRRPQPGDLLIEDVAGTAGQWHVYRVSDPRPDRWGGWFVGQASSEAAAIALAQEERTRTRIWKRLDPESRRVTLVRDSTP